MTLWETLLPLLATPVENLPLDQRHWWQNCHQYRWCCLHRRQVCHRCRWHRWQIMGTLSDCWHLKMKWSWRKKILYMLTLLVTQVWFLFSDWRFFDFSPVSLIPVVHLIWEYLCEFRKKFGIILIGYSGAGGKLIHEKILKSKMLWHYPFKQLKKYAKHSACKCNTQEHP